MSYSSLLLSTCTIQSYTDGAIDEYGVPAKTWNTFLADEACRLVSVTNTEVKRGAEVVLAEYRLFTADVGITEQMRVIKDSITYEVLSAVVASDGIATHHQESLLRTVR